MKFYRFALGLFFVFLIISLVYVNYEFESRTSYAVFEPEEEMEQLGFWNPNKLLLVAELGIILTILLVFLYFKEKQVF